MSLHLKRRILALTAAFAAIVSCTANNYMVYAETGTANQAPVSTNYSAQEPAVTIEDDVASTGYFRASVSGLPAGVAVTQYHWTTDEGEIQRQILSESLIIDPTSENIFVAYDGGEKTYTVTVDLSNGSTLTASKKVTYYKQIHNGDFEYPTVPATGSTTAGGVYIYNSAGSRWIAVDDTDSNLYWKTTDATGLVEIAMGGQNAVGAYHSTRATQFAELNSYNYGAIYQDILTYPGETLYWSFYHSGRSQQDTMQLIIDNVTNIPEGWDPANQEWSNDTVQATVTDGPNSWTYHEGSYTVPEGQYVTRFYFVSCNGSSNSIGNLIDDITFSTEVPSPLPNSLQYTINYYLDGNTLLSSDTGYTDNFTTVYPSKDKVDNYSKLYDVNTNNPSSMKVSSSNGSNVLNLYYTTPSYTVEYYTKASGSQAGYTKVTDSSILTSLVNHGTAVYGTRINNSTINAPSTLTIGNQEYSLSQFDGIQMTKGSDNVIKVYYEIPHTVTYDWGTESPSDAVLPSNTNLYFAGNQYSVDSTYSSSSTSSTSKDGVPGSWTFSGWKLGTNAVNGTQTMPNNNVTLNGTWTFIPDTYTVTYDWGTDAPSDAVLPTDGTVYDWHDGVTVDSAYDSSSTSNASKNGVPGSWTFSGWSASSELTEDGVEGNVTYTGNWAFTADTYTVTYDWGTNAPSDAVLPTDTTVYDWHDGVTIDSTYDSSSTSNASKNGVPGSWTFSGWTPSNKLTEDGVEGDITFTGEWTFTANTYTVTYVVKGDSIYGTPNDSNVPSAVKNIEYNGSTISAHLPTTLWTTSDGTVTGIPGTWSITDWDNNGTGTQISLIKSDIVETATWTFTPDTYTVTYEWGTDAPSDAVLPTDSTVYDWHDGVTVDNKYDSSSTSSTGKDGVPGIWTFSGWTASDELTEDGVEGNVTFTGEWTFTAEEKITPSVNDDEPTVNTPKTDRPQTPNTSDSTNMMYYFGLMLMSLLVVISTLIYQKKHR